jgi:putative membrane-bound dehydrogenase-like protein
MRCHFCAALLVFVFVAAPVEAQRGDLRDKTGAEQKEVVPRDQIPSAQAKSAAEELKTFRIAPGFHIELVAAEPFVEDPIIMQFDPAGRMWVVEMRGYMNTVDSDNEELPSGRVVILDGPDGGPAKTSTVFADGLIMPRALALTGGGALVGEPPHLWLMRAAKETGTPPSRLSVTDKFGSGLGWGPPSKGGTQAVEHGPNSPLWNMDNTIYFAEYYTRLRYSQGTFQIEPSTFRGEWGLTQDDVGHLFYNSNQSGLRGDVIPPHYTLRNPNQAMPRGINLNFSPDERVWPSRVNPGVNRGYQPGILVNGKLRQYTAACAPTIYRGGAFPAEFNGNCFVCEPAGNLVRRYVFKRDAAGQAIATNAYADTEFLTSTDERFRPVWISAGPDGCLYIVDMYHGILEDKLSQTSYLRKQIIERGLATPIHLGRIWRVVPDGHTPQTAPRLADASPAELVGFLSDANGWRRDTAQRLLVESGSPAVAPALRSLATASGNPLARLHALWTLDGLGQLDEKTLVAGLRDSDDRVRTAAVRLTESRLRDQATRDAMLGHLERLAVNPSHEVRIQLALSLGEARDPRAELIMTNLIREGDEDALLAYAVGSGLAHRELEVLEGLAADSGWRALSPGRAALVRELAGCVAYEREAARVERFLRFAGSTNPAWTTHLLAGFAQMATYVSRRPIILETAPAILRELQHSADKGIANAALKAETLLTWRGKAGALAPPAPLVGDELARFNQGKVSFNAICAGCHQEHGRGMEGMAPPLVDSEWVEGSPERLVRIVLGGMHGRVRVGRKNYDMEMPAWGALPDEQLAAILTYVRRAWDQRANPIDVGTIKRIRAATADHPSSWSADELLKL